MTMAGSISCRPHGEDAEVAVAYRASVAAPSPSPGVYGFALPLFGEISGGTVELRADNGAGVMRSGLLTSCCLRGNVAHLPPLSVFACHRHNFILSINLSVKNFILQ